MCPGKQTLKGKQVVIRLSISELDIDSSVLFDLRSYTTRNGNSLESTHKCVGYSYKMHVGEQLLFYTVIILPGIFAKYIMHSPHLYPMVIPIRMHCIR